MPAAAQHVLYLYTPGGTLLGQLGDFIKVDCVLAENAIGAIEVTLPMLYDDSFFQRDARLAFFRQPASDALRLVPRLVGNTVFLLVRRRKRQLQDGTWQQVITFVHPNHLLSRRIIPYNEGTSQALKTDLADDLIKAVIRENFTAATVTTRNWASSIFTVDVDTGGGATVRIEMSYRAVLETIQEVAAQSMTEGTYTGFEVSGRETGAMTFRTYTGQRGVDRSSTSGQPLIISAVDGSLTEVELDEDYTNAPSFIYALGQGALDERAVGTWENTTLTASSPWGRFELATNQSQTETTLMLEGVAKRRLWELRPRKTMTCRIVDTEQATFGEEYDWGDKIVAQFYTPFVFGTASGPFFDQRDARVDPVRITVDRVEDQETGEVSYVENLDIRLRSDA